MTTYTFIVNATPIDVSVKNILSDKSTILYDSYMNKLSCIPIGICNDAKLFNVIVEMYYDFGKFLVPLLENSKFDIVIDYKQLPRYLHVWQKLKFPEDDNYRISKKKWYLYRTNELQKQISQLEDNIKQKTYLLNQAKHAYLLAEESSSEPEDLIEELLDYRNILIGKSTKIGTKNDQVDSDLCCKLALELQHFQVRTNTRSNTGDFDALYISKLFKLCTDLKYDSKRIFELETCREGIMFIYDIPLLDSSIVYYDYKLDSLRQKLNKIKMNY